MRQEVTISSRDVFMNEKIVKTSKESLDNSTMKSMNMADIKK